ncbi:MAG: DUF6184 family natural product biosynthesis lipoprotein [Polyangiales bacterium]
MPKTTNFSKLALFLTPLVLLCSACTNAAERHEEKARQPSSDDNESVAAKVADTRLVAEPGGKDGGVAVTGQHRAAIMQITTAVCERSERCKAAGAADQFESMDACVDEVSKKWTKELSRYECPDRIDTGGLEACVESIGDDSCDGPLTALDRLGACRPNKICREFD